MHDSATAPRALEEDAVYSRYASAAHKRQKSLCCAVDYPAELLGPIPNEIIERDYGCGNPMPYVRTSETVLDLGSGAGKLCYMLSQIVGAKGRVIGVDCNREMLALARRYQETIAQRIGYANVEFRCGMIQDLALDLERLVAKQHAHALNGPEDWLELRGVEQHLRRCEPMIPDESIDCIVSNCVLNLVREEDRRMLFKEMHRVLRPGGRAAISDIVSDEDVPEHLRRDRELWSGCISGAFREDLFLQAFANAGFQDMELRVWKEQPWRTIEGIEFRSVTVVAHKYADDPCLERNQAVIYRGPFSSVTDDDGHTFPRGVRTAVCDKTFERLQHSPMSEAFSFLEPRIAIAPGDAVAYDCRRNAKRDPRETKGMDYAATLSTSGTDRCC